MSELVGAGGFDVAKLADYLGRFPFEWPELQADTLICCGHCGRSFAFIDAKLDDEGLLMCARFPECDASALDFFPDADVPAELKESWGVQRLPGVSEGA